MNTKKQLRVDLALDSIATINSLLKAAGRSSEVLRSSGLEAADEALVRAALPHLQSGKSATEAVKLAAGNGHSNDPQTDSETSNTGKGALSIQEKAQAQTFIQRKKDEQLALTQTAREATEFSEKLEEARWLMVAASRCSTQVQESDRVLQAKEFALGIGDGGLSKSSNVEGLDSYLQELDFFSQLGGVFAPDALTSSEEIDS